MKRLWLAAIIPLLLAGCGGHAMGRATPRQTLAHQVLYKATQVYVCAGTAGLSDGEIAERTGLPNAPRTIIIWKETCAHILAEGRIH